MNSYFTNSLCQNLTTNARKLFLKRCYYYFLVQRNRCWNTSTQIFCGYVHPIPIRVADYAQYTCLQLLDLLLSLHCGCAGLRKFVCFGTITIACSQKKVSSTKLIDKLSIFGCLSLKFHNQLCFNKHNMATWLDNTSRDTFLW